MKAKRATPKPARREIFVLTPEEKRAICFVLIALVLGLVTKHYRETHPPGFPRTDIRADGKTAPRSASREARRPKHEPSPSRP